MAHALTPSRCVDESKLNLSKLNLINDGSCPYTLQVCQCIGEHILYNQL